MKTKIGNNGQATLFDILMILLSITLFTVTVWAFTLGGKTAGTQAQRSKQDFTHSLLITTLYTTLDANDPRLRGKSISDVLGMYFTAEDGKVTKDFVKKQLREAEIHKYLKDKGSASGDIKWFLYEEEGKLCFQGNEDSVDECGEPVDVSSTTSASTQIIYSKKEGYDKRRIYLTIKWR